MITDEQVKAAVDDWYEYTGLNSEPKMRRILEAYEQSK